MIWKPLFALRCLLYRAFGNGDDASFHAAFANEFKGVDASDANLEAMATDAYELCNATVFPEAANTMKMLKYDGYKGVLVTESPEFLVKPLAKALGASRVIGGVLEKETRADGAVVFTGKLTGPPVVGEEKARAALRFAEEVGVNMKKSIAYGDGLGDAALMRACGKAYAVSPSVELRREAEANGVERPLVARGRGHDRSWEGRERRRGQGGVGLLRVRRRAVAGRGRGGVVRDERRGDDRRRGGRVQGVDDGGSGPVRRGSQRGAAVGVSSSSSRSSEVERVE